MSQHTADSAAQPDAWIEIQGGRTRFPRRPIRGDRFLIGAGSNCHLQLGGLIPMAHSVIQRTQDGWSIEALSSGPELQVRGQTVRQAELHPGDAIQIGPFSLAIHFTPQAAESLLAPIDIAATLAAANTAPISLELQSAEELLDGLTTELLAASEPAAREELLAEAVSAESDCAGVVIDEEQLVAAVMAQIEELAGRLASRESSDVPSVLPLATETTGPQSLPLRRSA